MVIKAMSSAKSKYKVTKSLLLIGILITGLLSAFIGLVAYFGQYMGTFVISLDDLAIDLGITLSDNPEFENNTSRLLVNPVNSATPTTFADINFKKAVSTNGDMDKSEANNYIAYTFYVRNEGNVATDIELNLNITSVTNNVDKALRIAIIEGGYVDEDDNVKFTKGTLYRKDDGNGDEVVESLVSIAYEEDEYGNKIYRTKDFYDSFAKETMADDGSFGNYVLNNFVPNEVRKFTIVFWLEGWDLDCGNELKYGQLKMKMIFSVRKVDDEEEATE